MDDFRQNLRIFRRSLFLLAAFQLVLAGHVVALEAPPAPTCDYHTQYGYEWNCEDIGYCTGRFEAQLASTHATLSAKQISIANCLRRRKIEHDRRAD